MDRAALSRAAHGKLALYSPLSERDLDEAIALLDLPAGARVLDVGCGTGEVLRRIAARWDVRLYHVESRAARLPGGARPAAEAGAERHGGERLRERAAVARRRLTMPGGRETLGFALLLLRG